MRQRRVCAARTSAARTPRAAPRCQADTAAWRWRPLLAGSQVSAAPAPCCLTPAPAARPPLACAPLQVKFKKLEAPGEEGFTLELLRGLDYAAVTAALAQHLGIVDPDLLRLTQHSNFTQQPQRHPMPHRYPGELLRMLTHGHHVSDTL